MDKCLTDYAEVKQHTLFDGCNEVDSPCIRVLTLFELYSAQELLNCDIQANVFFFSKVILSTQVAFIPHVEQLNSSPCFHINAVMWYSYLYSSHVRTSKLTCGYLN